VQLERAADCAKVERKLGLALGLLSEAGLSGHWDSVTVQVRAVDQWETPLGTAVGEYVPWTRTAYVDRNMTSLVHELVHHHLCVTEGCSPNHAGWEERGFNDIERRYWSLLAGP